MTRLFKPKSSTVHERFGDETVILNLDSGAYFSVQGSGGAIWEMIEGGVPEAAIIARLQLQDLAADRDRVARATVVFIDQLVEESLIEPAPEAMTAREPGPAAASVFAEPVLQKYTDMEEMLLLDPIHEVDEHGWPSARKDA